MKYLSTFVCCAALTTIMSYAPVSAQVLASWSMTAAGPMEHGLRALSGSDGNTVVVERGGSRCLTLSDDPINSYIYFAVTDTAAVPVDKPIFVILQYFDGHFGGNMGLQYDSNQGTGLMSHFLSADNAAGGWIIGAKKWHSVIFEIDHPRFLHGENLQADFRITGGGICVRSVQIATSRPQQWQALASQPIPRVAPAVAIGTGSQLIVGGFDAATLGAVKGQVNSLRTAIPALKELGVTSVEIYVRWNLVERSPGKFDWSAYDQFVSVLKKNHLKWSPMIICGSAYSLPDWFYKKAGYQGYVCLEHHQESDVQSHWNPAMQQHMAQFMKALCLHYGKTGTVENMILGVSGNYGEAIYPISGNDWTAETHGDYHTHPGYWAADPYAVVDFRRWVMHRYRTPAALQAVWGAKSPSTFAAVQPFLQADAPNNRAWVDMMDWYQGSMTDYAKMWLQATRRYFPTGGVELCTGGDAAPVLGSNFAAQCRAAGEYSAGVRITNEGSDYGANFTYTRWIASACRQYGAFFSYEPAGGVDADGVVARIYNATASGAKGLHYYFGNLYNTDAATQSFIRQGAHWQQRKPLVEIGVYYPETSIQLRGENFLSKLQPLRDRFDFGFMSDTQIADGGLHSIKALVLVDGNIAEASTWQRIEQWVKQGGVLIYPKGMGSLQTVEGDEAPINGLIASKADHVYSFDGVGDSDSYRNFVTHTLASLSKLSPATRAMLTQDGVEDHIYSTVTAPKQLLWFNATHAPAIRHAGTKTFTIPPITVQAEQL